MKPKKKKMKPRSSTALPAKMRKGGPMKNKKTLAQKQEQQAWNREWASKEEYHEKD